MADDAETHVSKSSPRLRKGSLVAAVLKRIRGSSKSLRRGERNELGARAERFVYRRLKREGYRILGRNLETAGGEVDLLVIDPDGKTIVLVEVKCRSGTEGVPPEQHVTAEKRRRLGFAAAALRRANSWEHRAMRIDVVGVDWPRARGESPVMRHHKGV